MSGSKSASSSALKVGLEIHSYVLVENKEKLFCSCRIDARAAPNTTVCPRCTGQPGSKPMLPNRQAVEKVLKTGLILNCSINTDLVWQRKHYDYPDLPCGYQKTMSGSYAVPVGEHGAFLGVGIREIHLEEDPARWDPVTGCVDYNRSGYPLIEIVTEPDFSSSEQVREWLEKLMVTLSYVKAVDRSMGLKCDVNVSVAPKFQRVELKNINSFSSIIAAIEAESSRQRREVAAGKDVPLQTRAWVDERGESVFMRSKEQALDYRFIPDPDLPLVEVRADLLRGLEKSLPEKPQVKEKKMVKLGVEVENARIIATDVTLAYLFEELAKHVDPVLAARWLRKELLRVINLSGKSLEDIDLDETHVIELLRMLERNEITEQVGRRLLEQLIEKPFSPREHVRKSGQAMISESSELERFAREAIKSSPQAVADYRSGKEIALNFIVGQVMKATHGKAKPQEVKEIVKKLLE